MAGWLLSWRVSLRRDWGWPGPVNEVVTVATVGQLREVVLAARADPAILSCRWWRHREWDDTGVPARAPCGHEWVPVGISDITDCACGLGHRRLRCHNHGVDVVYPEYRPGCGPVPRDPDAAGGSGRWRPVTAGGRSRAEPARRR